jgi:hypothetical protein
MYSCVVAETLPLLPEETTSNLIHRTQRCRWERCTWEDVSLWYTCVLEPLPQEIESNQALHTRETFHLLFDTAMARMTFTSDTDINTDRY